MDPELSIARAVAETAKLALIHVQLNAQIPRMQHRTCAAVPARVLQQRSQFPRRRSGGGRARQSRAVPVEQGTGRVSQPITQQDLYEMKACLHSQRDVGHNSCAHRQTVHIILSPRRAGCLRTTATNC